MRRLAAGAFAAAIVGGLVLGACGLESVHGPQCVFLSITGLPCPFCGMTRATLALGAGDVARAFALHPLAPFVLVASFAMAVHVARGRTFSRRAPAIVLGALAAMWVAKLIAWAT